MSSEAIIIRNFEMMRRVFDNLDILSSDYKLSRKHIELIQQLLMKHNSYNAYIEIKTKDFGTNRRPLYRALDKFENENIITIINRPKNQHDSIKVYFTVRFIHNVCGEDFANLYEKWLDWQLQFKQEGEDK